MVTRLGGIMIPHLSLLLDACHGTSVGMFLRLLKVHVNTDMNEIGPLGEQQAANLGKVVCERASPFPCHTYDTTTLYIIISFPQWINTKLDRVTETGMNTYGFTDHLKLHTFGEEAIADLLFGIIFCKCTGRVCAINAFAQHAYFLCNKDNTQIPPFLSELHDLMLFLSFLYGTCGSNGAGRMTKKWAMQEYQVPRSFSNLVHLEELLRSILGTHVVRELIQISRQAHNRRWNGPKVLGMK